MRRPQKTMPDVTRDLIDEALEVGDGALLNVETKRPILASGDVRALPVCDGLFLHVAQLRGQGEYNADIMSVSGMALEVRLDGCSQSVRGDDGLTRRITAGSFALSATKEPRRWHVTAPAQDAFRTVSIIFTADFVRQLGDAGLQDFAAPMFDLGACHTGKASVAAKALAEQVLVTDPKAPLAKVRLQAACLSMLTECVSLCLDARPAVAQPDEHVVARAKDHVRKHADQALTISDVAAHCRVSPSSLKSSFLKAEGVSLGRHIRTVRMQTARDMLENGVPIVNVSEVLNYSAPEALTRAFSNHFGFPPSQASRS